MTVIPLALRKEMAADPEYAVCALASLLPNLIGSCDGSITWEHAIYFAGKKLQLRWAIVPCCEKHHGVNTYLDGGTALKEIRVWVALNRATPEELKAISKSTNYFREKQRLNNKYGIYKTFKI